MSPFPELLDGHDLVDHEPATDPGAEVLDLPDDLVLSVDDLALPSLTMPAGFFRTAAPVDFAAAVDYEPATWLAIVLRRAGVRVVEHPGWQSNGRPRSAGPFRPRGVLWHHDGSGVGPSPHMARFIADGGRPDAGIPAPLSQVWICAGCEDRHPVGTWHVLAAGRANHAGAGAGFGRIGRDAGNTATLGVEMDNTTGEPTPPAMYASLVRGTAAILNHLRSDPRLWLAGHKEYARGRKVDPDDLDMSAGRRDVAVMMRRLRSESRPHNENRPAAPAPAPVRPKPGGHAGTPRPDWSPRPFPGRVHFVVGHACGHGAVEQLQTWLDQVGLDTGDRGPAFTPAARRAVRAFQQRTESLSGDADGLPGPMTWRVLQQAARDARRAARGT